MVDPRNRRWLGLGALVTLALVMVWSVGTLAAGITPPSVHVNPSLPNPCELCHSVRPDKSLGMDKLSGNNKCYSCHSDAVGPVFVRATFEASAHAALWPVKSKTPAVWPGRGAQDKGLCANCHDPHGTKAESMLRAGTETNSNKACYACHTDFAAYGAYVGSTAYEASSPHGNPVTGVKWPGSDYVPGECVNCHNPHGTTGLKMLRAGGNSLCYTCHERAGALGALWPGKTGYARAGGVHSTVIKGKLTGECVDCHNPHATRADKTGLYARGLTNQPGERLCYQCHKDKEREFFLPSHGVGSAGSRMTCTSCHNPHIITKARPVSSPADTAMSFPMLPQAPATVMTSTSAGNDFCLSCHGRGVFAGPAINVQIELDSPIASTTGFHDRTGNLHSVHVRANLGCANCHDPHASKNRYGRLLYDWISVTPGYANKNRAQAKTSCSTAGGSLGLCH